MGIERTAKYAKRTLQATLVVLVVCLVVLVIGQAAGRWQLVEVQGGSMQPTIANGSAVLTVPSAPALLQPGDVVTMVGDDGARVTHRVVSIDEETHALITRGDANFVDDAGQFAGEVEQVRAIVPGGGLALRGVALLASNPWVMAAILLGLALPYLPHRSAGGDKAVAA